MLFLEAFCCERHNSAGYKARLLLWQWKQWLNIGTDWNNHAVCPLVPQTSCLTKLNPCWCRAFRPVSLSLSRSLCLSLKKKKNLFLLFVRFCPHPHIGVTGYWREATFCSFRRQRRWIGDSQGVNKKSRDTGKVDRKRNWGQGENEHEIEG